MNTKDITLEQILSLCAALRGGCETQKPVDGNHDPIGRGPSGSLTSFEQSRTTTLAGLLLSGLRKSLSPMPHGSRTTGDSSRQSKRLNIARLKCTHLEAGSSSVEGLSWMPWKSRKPQSHKSNECVHFEVAVVVVVVVGVEVEVVVGVVIANFSACSITSRNLGSVSRVAATDFRPCWIAL